MMISKRKPFAAATLNEGQLNEVKTPMQRQNITPTVKINSKNALGHISRRKNLSPLEKAKQNPKSLRYAVNATCYECSGFDRSEVKNCEMTDCPLYRKRPWQKKQGST